MRSTTAHHALYQPPQHGYETRLVARFQAGDAEALGSLFEMHVDRVFAYARTMVGSREDAEEVVSEAFLRAFERAASFRGECPFRGWLLSIARNLCFDRLRQQKMTILSPEMDEASDAGRSAGAMETRLVVQEALGRLSEEHRAILLLCDVEQWDAKEVASLLEKSLAATKSMLYRARRELRDEITALGLEEEGAEHAV